MWLLKNPTVHVLTGSETEQWLGCKRSSETGAGQHHGQNTILLGEVVLLPTLCRPHFLEAGLHFLQDFGGVSYYQLHCSLSRLEQLHSLLVVLSFHTLKEKDSYSHFGLSKTVSVTVRSPSWIWPFRCSYTDWPNGGSVGDDAGGKSALFTHSTI